MRLPPFPLLCLGLLLCRTDFALSGKGGKGISFGKGFGIKKPPTNRGSNTGSKTSQGTSSHAGYPSKPGGSYPQQPGGYPQQPGGYPQQPGGYPQQPGRYPQQPGGYPQQPGGYPHQPGGYPQQPGGYPHQPGGYPQQPGGYPHQPGGYPQQPGGYPHQPGGYPHQPGGYPQQPGGYPHQPYGYPQQPGGYPQQPRPGGYPNQPYGYPQHPAGSPYAGGFGGYPGGYINQNPNNKILSPHYGGSFGYGGYRPGGGSPFSQSVQAMNVRPNEKSKGFGRTAVLAAAGGAVAGMAVGYGLGRFPRPPFSFHSPQEEYYYNHYMYRTYGVRSSDSNDYSRDYRYSPPPKAYDNYMESCMKRTDLLPPPRPKPATTTAPATTTTTTAAANATLANATLANATTAVTTPPEAGADNNTANADSQKSSVPATPTPATPAPLPSAAGQAKGSTAPPPPQALRVVGGDDDDDDTVSIAEIGYPALIEQVKARRCLELYMVYSEKYLKKVTDGPAGGAAAAGAGPRGLVAALAGALLALRLAL